MMKRILVMDGDPIPKPRLPATFAALDTRAAAGSGPAVLLLASIGSQSFLFGFLPMHVILRHCVRAYHQFNAILAVTGRYGAIYNERHRDPLARGGFL